MKKKEKQFSLIFHLFYDFHAFYKLIVAKKHKACTIHSPHIPCLYPPPIPIQVYVVELVSVYVMTHTLRIKAKLMATIRYILVLNFMSEIAISPLSHTLQPNKRGEAYHIILFDTQLIVVTINWQLFSRYILVILWILVDMVTAIMQEIGNIKFDFRLSTGFVVSFARFAFNYYTKEPGMSGLVANIHVYI